MAEQDSRFRKFVHWIAPNAIWDFIKWVGGSSVIASIAHLLWSEFHKNTTDWYSIAGYFVVGVILVLVAVFFQYRNKKSPMPITPNHSNDTSQRGRTKLVIRRAVYGAGGQTDTDITESLQNAERDGLVIPVDNLLVPSDLAFGVRKRLHVEYSFGDGTIYYAARMESIPGDYVRLVLPEDTEAQKVGWLRKEIEELKGKIAAFPKPPDESQTTLLTLYSHIDQITPAKYEYADAATYKHKVRFHIRNSFDQTIELWSPIWESKEILAQTPHCAKFVLQSKDGTSTEAQSVTLPPYQEIKGWIGLMQPPSGDGLEFRLAHLTTGYLMFPLKVFGKMQYARLKM